MDSPHPWVVPPQADYIFNTKKQEALSLRTSFTSRTSRMEGDFFAFCRDRVYPCPHPRVVGVAPDHDTFSVRLRRNPDTFFGGHPPRLFVLTTTRSSTKPSLAWYDGGQVGSAFRLRRTSGGQHPDTLLGGQPQGLSFENIRGGRGNRR